MIKTLKIKDAAQIDKIARLASGAPYEIFLHTGRTTLNARILPLMRMYTLIGRKVTVVAEDSADPIHFGRLVDEMAKAPKRRRTFRQRVSDIIYQMELLYGREARLKHTEC